jgi:hypothetical protein
MPEGEDIMVSKSSPEPQPCNAPTIQLEVRISK